MESAALRAWVLRRTQPPLRAPNPVSAASLFDLGQPASLACGEHLTIGSAGKTFSVTGWKVRGWGDGEPSLYNRWREEAGLGIRKGMQLGPQEASPSPCVLGPGGLGPWPADRLMKHLRTVHPELHRSVCHPVPGEGVAMRRGQVRGGRR